MSFPAARIRDLTMHGGMITLGTPTTLIGNMPASRLGDLHTCPMVTVLVPHVGGPIVFGAFNVLVGGPPQARILDPCVCVGPPSMVVLGEFTVLVGMAGAFSGGIGGFLSLLLGGFAAGLQNLLGQYPRAVACPVDAQNPAGYYTQYGPGIVIRGTPEFQAQALDRLHTMEQTNSGRQVIDSINNSGHTMTVVEFTGNNSYCGPNNTWADLAGSTPAGQQVYDGEGHPIMGPDGNPLLGTGRGADTTLQLNPNLTIANSLDPGHPMPNDAVAFHEMDHGAHQMNGQQDTSPMAGGWDTHEENNTISAGNPSEADYLAERGYPYHRTDHDSHWAHN